MKKATVWHNSAYEKPCPECHCNDCNLQFRGQKPPQDRCEHRYSKLNMWLRWNPFEECRKCGMQFGHYIGQKGLNKMK